jgi:hypothetical protein
VPDSIKAKKSCCKDKPRCKRCPVVLKRLSAAGLAERTGPRTYVPAPGLKKKHITAARTNRPLP